MKERREGKGNEGKKRGGEGKQEIVLHLR